MKVLFKSMNGRRLPGFWDVAIYSVWVCLPIRWQGFGTFSDRVAETWSKINSLSSGAYSIDRGAPKAMREEQRWETTLSTMWTLLFLNEFLKLCCKLHYCTLHNWREIVSVAAWGLGMDWFCFDEKKAFVSQCYDSSSASKSSYENTRVAGWFCQSFLINGNLSR